MSSIGNWQLTLGNWRLAIGIFVSLLLLCPAALADSASPLTNQPLAVVNRETVTRDDLDRALLAGLGDEIAENAADPQKGAVARHRVALRALIERKLLLAEAERLQDKQEALRRALDIPVQDKIERAERLAGGPVAFREYLRKRGMTYADYRERVRDDLLCQVVVDDFVRRGLSVSPIEMRDYYSRHPDKFREPAVATYRQIFVRAAAPDDEAALQKRDRIAMALAEGAEFAELARAESDGPHAPDGGAWTDQRPGMRPKTIDDLVFSLPVGRVGGPVETEIGWTFLLVEDRAPGGVVPFEQAQAAIRERLLAAKEAARYEDLIARLARQNHVEILLPNE